MVIKSLQIQVAVDVELAIVRDGVTQRCAVLQLRTTLPVVSSGIGGL